MAAGEEEERQSQIILDPDLDLGSEADTIPDDTLNSTGLGSTFLISDGNSLTSLSDEEEYNETGPMREDMPITRSRWRDEEVDSLMDAINVNREAIKFNFQGPGGGKDVKRQGWKDVVSYVNDVADTHRTIKMCRDKAASYSQRVKGKFNKLRFQVSQTGRGRVSKKYHIKETEGKALDYLRSETVKGISGIEPTDPGGVKVAPSSTNLKLLWSDERQTKPDYKAIQMPRAGVPKKYKEKNKRRVEREKKEKRKRETEEEMKKERREERLKQKEEKKIAKQEKERRKKIKGEKKRRLGKDLGIKHGKREKVEQKEIGKEKVNKNKVKKEGHKIKKEETKAKKKEGREERKAERAARRERNRIRQEKKDRKKDR